MKAKAVRKVLLRILIYSFLVAVVLFFVFGTKILYSLYHGRNLIETRIGSRLFDRHGLVFLADFDEAAPLDSVSRLPLNYSFAPRTTGKFGTARTVDLDARTLIQLPVNSYMTKSQRAAFAAWFKPENTERKQVLFAQKLSGSNFRLVLETNVLHLSVSDNDFKASVPAVYSAKKGKFSHILVNLTDSGIELYQNGRQSAAILLEKPLVLPLRITNYGIEEHSPFEGDIDELAIWNRSLSAKEIHALANFASPLKLKYEPKLSCFSGFLKGALNFCSGFYRTFGRLVPSMLYPAPVVEGVPRLTLWPSDKDSRHFLVAHEKSLFNGYRTSKAAQFRSLDLSIGDTNARVEVALDDTYGRCDGKRKAFIVRDPSRKLIAGSGIVRLYPPELHLSLHPDSKYPLPLSASFVRLYSKTSFKGLYVIEPFERTGSAWMARGERDVSFKKALYFAPLPADCELPPEGKTPDEAFEEVTSLVLSDVSFPWSKKEVKSRKKTSTRRFEQQAFNHSVSSMARLGRSILADNPSLLYVTNNLALNLPGIAWESSAPELVSAEGRVSRPAKGAPVPVLLTPLSAGGKRGTPVRVRVVPFDTPLQTLFLHVGNPIAKHKKRDFVCYRYPAGGGAPELLSGFADTGGGVKHRGNTSYVRGAKRSLSLEFDSPVLWPGMPGNSQHVFLFSGYADPTRLRNKISFDSYIAAASSDGTPCGAIPVSWSEVFINGEYFGVWETTPRVKDISPPGTILFKVRERNVDLWNTLSTEMVECVSEHQYRRNPYEKLEDLFRFTSEASAETFAERGGDVFFVDSVVDFYLLINFTQNYDGQITNQYIARDKESKKWYIVPWDYDKTFFDPERIGLSSFLPVRFVNEYPGFRERLYAKWAALRSGPLSDEAVMARIDSDAALLAPYMVDEYILLQPEGWDGDFKEAVESLKSIVSGRLKLMDSKFLK